MSYQQKLALVLAMTAVVAILSSQEAQACPMTRAQAAAQLAQIRMIYPDLLNQQQQYGQQSQYGQQLYGQQPTGVLPQNLNGVQPQNLNGLQPQLTG